jgi:putative hydrolase of the HAD superfamily
MKTSDENDEHTSSNGGIETIHVVSFDLEGTLLDMTFSEKVWNEGLPRLYAEKYKMDFSEARNIVLREYARVGDERVEWYDLEYWFKRFGLSNPEGLLEAYRGFIQLFHETIDVLEKLSRKFKLIVITNSSRLFVNVLTDKIAHYFSRIFSATSDFGLLKKNPESYQRICQALNVKPWEMVHIGDRLQDDFESPRSIGVKAYLLNRTENKNLAAIKFTVKNLNEFANLLFTKFRLLIPQESS